MEFATYVITQDVSHCIIVIIPNPVFDEHVYHFNGSNFKCSLTVVFYLQADSSTDISTTTNKNGFNSDYFKQELDADEISTDDSLNAVLTNACIKRLDLSHDPIANI